MKLTILVLTTSFISIACLTLATKANDGKIGNNFETDGLQTRQVQEKEGSSEDSNSNPEKTDWKQDPACKAVFFAVLEGLYNDGVQDDVIESIIGPKSDATDVASMRERMGRSFVLDCPLCQPTFEALIVYQNRPQFSDGSGMNHFGDEGLENELREKLLSEELMPRLMAMQTLFLKWTKTKLQSLDLDQDTKTRLTRLMNQRSNEGKGMLMKLISESEHYSNWPVYYGCAACKAAEKAAAQVELKDDQE